MLGQQQRGDRALQKELRKENKSWIKVEIHN